MAVGFSNLERLLAYAVPVGAAMLLIRLWHEKLLSRYRFVSFSLLCDFAGISFLVIPRSKIVYLYSYTVYEAIVSAALIGLVMELFSQIVREYPGIRQSGRSFMRYAFGLAILGSLLFALLYPQTGPGVFATLEHYFLVFRVIAFALMAFLVLLMIFVLWFPIRLSRNVLLLASGYSFYLTCRALTRLAANLFGPKNYVMLGTISMAVLFVCLVSWILLLTRRGEKVDLIVGGRRNPDRSELLVKQLEAINAALLGRERPKSNF